MMVFFTLSALKVDVAAWLHLLMGTLRNDFPLPFIRMFFPQVAVPLLAFYFLLCKKAWDRGGARDYVALVVLQVAAFISFPYSSVLMGLATLAFLLLIANRSDLPKRVSYFCIVGLACMAVDGLYLRMVLPRTGLNQAMPANFPALHLDLSQLRVDFGGTAVLLLVLSGLLLLLRGKDSSRVMVVSIGLANVAMLLADCVVDPRLLVSHHAGYFVQISLGLELCALCYWAGGFFSASFYRRAAAAASVFFVANGALASLATIRASAETNNGLANFAQVIRTLNLGPDDLVIAPARDVDDVSTALPLLTRAHALYTPEAEILLSPADENLVNGRQAAYLFLSGRDSNWVESQLAKHLLSSAVLSLRQRFALFYHHRSDLVEAEIRKGLLRQLVAIDQGLLPLALATSHRVVVLDDAKQPVFEDVRIRQLLTVSENYEIGSIRVRLCSALGNSGARLPK